MTEPSKDALEAAQQQGEARERELLRKLEALQMRLALNARAPIDSVREKSRHQRLLHYKEASGAFDSAADAAVWG